MTTATIKKLFKAFETAEAESDRLEAAWEKEPENETLEAAWDQQYKKLYKAQQKLEEAITEFSGIDQETVHTMVGRYRDRLKDLINRAA